MPNTAPERRPSSTQAQAWAEQVLAQTPQVHAFDGARCERMVARVLAHLAASPDAAPDAAAPEGEVKPSEGPPAAKT